MSGPPPPYTRTSSPSGWKPINEEALAAWWIERGKIGAQALKVSYVEPPATEIARATIDRCRRWDLDPYAASGQMDHECAGYQSRAAREKNNPGGFGAENDLPFEQWPAFETVEEGIDRVLGHIASYTHGEGEWTDDGLPHSRVGRLRTLGYLGIVSELWHFEQRYAWTRPDVYAATPIELRYGARVGGRAEHLRQFVLNWKEQPMAPYDNVIRGLIDRRHELAINRGTPKPFGPSQRIPLDQKRGVVIHYGGPPPANPGTFAVAQGYATYHVNRNWARSGNPVIHGDGLMYHVAVGRNGEKWLCRDLESVLWHCGVTEWNRRSLSIQFLLGGTQRATVAQIQAAREVVDDWCVFTKTPPSQVWGHQELSPTDCPGTLLQDFVYPYRNGQDKPMADGHFFAQTGHYVGGGFWVHWRENGGLPIFGYPLSEEFDIADSQAPGGKRTIQVFERAVFEYHPENKPPHDILLRRLGADVLDDLLKQKAA